MSFRKKRIPEATRRAVAREWDCEPGQTVRAICAYCEAEGLIHWITKSWVYFTGLEMDHIIPEWLGGDGSPSNITLACPSCNRSKGHKTITHWKAP